MEKKETGYPHIDKPWMKWYPEDVRIKYDTIEYPDVNLTQYLKDVNKNNMNAIAERYYGKETTYEEMFYNTDVMSKVLSQIGVKKGDKILTLTPNIPEGEKVWLGAAQIGAIADYIDPRPDNMADLRASALKVLELIKFENPQYIVAFDACFPAMIKPIENELKEMGITDVILLSATDSMDKNGKLEYMLDVINYDRIAKGKDFSYDKSLAMLKDYKTILEKVKAQKKMAEVIEGAVKTSPLNIYKYSDLARECKNSSLEIVNDPDLINYIGHTSGTSGSRPKPISHTNKGAISSLIQLQDAGVGPTKGNSSLHMLPFFAPFGAYNNGVQVYANGGTHIHVPEFVMSEFGYLLPRHKPNTIMGPPSFYQSFLTTKYLENEDMSYLKEIIYGGDSMSAKDEELINKFLKDHNSPAVVTKGHGLSETQGCAAYANHEYNVPDSIGIPLPGTIYAMIDPENDEEVVPVKFEEGKDELVAELFISGPHVTPGTLDDKTIIPHYNLEGLDGIRTRDLISMDRDGICKVLERKDRSFARIDGFKIQPYVIESEILNNSDIKQVKVVEYFDEKIKGKMPICHVVLTDEAKEKDEIDIVRGIVNGIMTNPNMVSRQIPTKFKFREEMPLNKGNKVDFKALEAEELSGDEINVDIDETNVSIGGINIYRNSDIKTRTRK